MTKALSPFWNGSAVEVGTALRSEWGAAWEALERRWRAGGDRVIDSARVEVLHALLEEWAPEWLLEAEAFARDGLEGYLDFQCRAPVPEPDTPAGANCSTALVLGSATTGGLPLLLKIRDEAPNPQVRFRRKLGGAYAVLSGTNLGNLGIAQMANEAGLVGANNTGGPLRDRSSAVGLNDCLVMRLIAERCATCEEAVRLLERLAAGKALGNGGYARGMIFLLADATGRGVIAECTRSEVVYREVSDGVHWRTNHFLFPEMEAFGDPGRSGEVAVRSSLERYQRATRLGDAHPVLTPEALMEISRDTEGRFPLCQTGSAFPWRTVSAWVHEVGLPAGWPSRSWCCDVAPQCGDYVLDRLS